MLSPETVQVVKSTRPLLKEHGENITKVFYQRLFNQHPDLKHVFNLVNQKRGEQPRALADAVIAYADNLDNLSSLLPLVKRIAHKHASLGITPEQYPIVGENLLAAIGQVLNLSATHPAILAWGEAYRVLADIFIGVEEDIYKENEGADGGWRGLREFEITQIVSETNTVKSFYFKPTDGAGIPQYKGGQYIGLKVKPLSSGYDEIRQYSLSGKSGQDFYRVSVRAENNGLVSAHLHQSKKGDKVFLQPPTGVFTLNPESKKHILICGGVGVTPIISMLYDALGRGVKGENILLIQCVKNAADRVLGDELDELVAAEGFVYKTVFESGEGADHVGYINGGILNAWLNENDFNATPQTDAYFCGPKPFMLVVNQLLQSLDFSENNIHCETFGPT